MRSEGWNTASIHGGWHESSQKKWLEIYQNSKTDHRWLMKLLKNRFVIFTIVHLQLHHYYQEHNNKLTFQSIKSISTDMISSPPRLTYLYSQNRSNLTSTFEEHLPDSNSERKTWELGVSYISEKCVLLFKQIDKMIVRERKLTYFNVQVHRLVIKTYMHSRLHRGDWSNGD